MYVYHNIIRINIKIAINIKIFIQQMTFIENFNNKSIVL